MVVVTVVVMVVVMVMVVMVVMVVVMFVLCMYVCACARVCACACVCACVQGFAVGISERTRIAVGNSERTRIFYHKQMRRHASVPARGWLLLGCRRNVTKHLCVCMCVCVQGPAARARPWVAATGVPTLWTHLPPHSHVEVKCAHRSYNTQVEAEKYVQRTRQYVKRTCPVASYATNRAGCFRIQRGAYVGDGTAVPWVTASL